LLLSDDNLRLKMSAAAARHAAQFDWDKVAQDWQSVFLEVASKRRKKF
jgi:glycosyltransferase involved in cell wall biosynthesis